MTVNKKVYITFGDIYKALMDNLYTENGKEYKSFFNNLGEKKVTSLLILLISDIIDKKIVLSRGIIHTQESAAVALFKDNSMTLLEAERCWWFVYDNIKELLDQCDHTVLNGGIRVGPNYYLDVKDSKLHMETT